MLLISIDILLAINNSKSLPLPRSFSVPLGNGLYFSIHRSCMPFAKHISVYFTVFLVSLADCLSFYISVPVCEQKKSEFLPTWMLFVLFFLPNCSCERFSRAVRDSGKGICLSIRGALCFFRTVPSQAQEVLCFPSVAAMKGHPMKWAGQGAAWLLLSLRCAALGLHGTGCVPARIPLNSLLDSLCSFYTCPCEPLIFCLLMCI